MFCPPARAPQFLFVKDLSRFRLPTLKDSDCRHTLLFVFSSRYSRVFSTCLFGSCASYMRAGRFYNFDRTLYDWRGRSGGRQWKNWSLGIKAMAGRRWVPVVILSICLLSLLHRIKERPQIFTTQNVERELWSTAPSLGWRPSCAQQSSAWFPPRKSNGYLVVQCDGSLNEQRSAICNAVLAARIMNATLVLPQLDSNLFWHDESGFSGLYDAAHFITSLKNDVRVVQSLPTMWAKENKRMKLEPFQLNPPRDAPARWYETVALQKLKEHGAVYLTSFSQALAEELHNYEYQRLRCRVNYHALRFANDVRNLSRIIVDRLRLEGPYMSIHLGFEMDLLAFTGCLDIFNSTEQEILKMYRSQNSAGKELESKDRQLIDRCPLTPKEVGLFLHALGFDNSTRIYLATGEIFGGKRFLDPLQALFPLLETRSTVAMADELKIVNAEGPRLLGPAVDYLVCLLSDIFVPTNNGPSNFASNLIGHRLYYGFRTTVQPDRKALTPLFLDLENGITEISDFEGSVRMVMSRTSSGGPHTRVPPESIFSNPWPECFCSNTPNNGANHCPSKTILNLSFDEDQDDIFAGWNI